MRVIDNLDAAHSAPSVTTIGNFDGVHRGHQQLLGQVRDRARELGVLSTVVTFEPPTRAVVRPDQPLQLLTALPTKLALFADLGLDQAAVVHFTPATAQLGAPAFLTWLTGAIPLVELWVGAGFALGHQRTGNTHVLAELGRERGFKLQIFPPLVEAEQVISSTAVRQALATGAVTRARELLGRDYLLPGRVVPGARRGRELGFPTANVEPPPHQAIPADGIYATVAVRPATGERLPSITSIGVRPTFAPSERLVEVYILDFADDLYGEELGIEFVEYLRPQVAYTGAAPLIAQMHQDVARARAILGAAGPV